MPLKASDARLGVVSCLIALTTAWTSIAADQPPTLKVGVAQLALEPTLAANRDKITALIGEAKARGCRVVVFPETALYWPPEATKAEIDGAVELLRKTVDAHDLYALIGGLYKRDEKDKPFERLLIIDPEGQIIQTYNKMWHDARFNECPGIFEIDGVPCAAALCGDRWIRSVEDLPAVAGAKILFECSNNYANEWLPELGHYWYVPRAIRNEVFVVFANTAKEDRGQLTPGHGHSAVIGPDGTIITAAGEEADKLLVAEIDLSLAIGGEAQSRRSHPALARFWDTGVSMLAGQRPVATAFKPLTSPAVELKIAAAQMACSRRIEDNVAQMINMIRSAASQHADAIVFPELALTGAREDDISAANQAEIEAGVAQIAKAAAESKVHVAFGLPWRENGKTYNSAVVLGPDGRQLTRYDQLVVDRPQLFAPGSSTHAMWCLIQGAPCVVTIGRDALWSELAEMAAWRGAQVHLHLAYAHDSSADAALRRQQIWANLASFRTFTATVNAASPAGVNQPSEPASGRSALWDDYHRAASGKPGGYFPHSAVMLTSAADQPTILYASQKIPKSNPQFQNLTDKTNKPMTAWYVAGAQAIDAPGGSAAKNTLTTTGPFLGGKFRGRIAYSADGNHNDPDDWAASPMALAIFAAAGVEDRLVHFDYNCILPDTNAEWEKIHADSVLGTMARYGYDASLFIDCRQELEKAVASLTQAIDASSADDPLYLIVAGPVEVPYLAIERSNPAKRQFVYCISHSRWNDGYAAKYKFTHTKRRVIETGINWIQIRDQNRLLSLSPYGKPSPLESFQPFYFLRDANDEKLRFVWERMLVSTRPDPSDAGMAYFLVSGDEDADPAKLRRLLADHVAPDPIAVRAAIRLEAENFRQLDGYEVEDTSDRNASHRLAVRPVAGRDASSIRTTFREPFAALRGRYDVELRYFSNKGRGSQLSLTVGGARQSAEAVETNGGWTSHTFRGVEVAAGEEMMVTTAGEPVRLDYLELQAR